MSELKLIDANKVIDIIDLKIKGTEFLMHDMAEYLNEYHIETMTAYVSALETLRREIEEMPPHGFYEKVRWHCGDGMWITFNQYIENKDKENEDG